MSEEIGKLKVSLSLDGGAEFNRSLSSAERNLKTMGGELAILRQKGKDWGSSIDGLKTRQETLGRTLQQQESYVKQLKDAYEDSVKTKGKDAKATEQLATKLNKAIAEYTRTETEIEQVSAALKKQEAELKQAESGWTKFADNAEKAGQSMQDAGEKMGDVGQKLSVGLTAPLAAAGLASIKVAGDFDASQGKMQASLGLTEKEAEKLHDQAESLWKNGFGENIGEASAAITNVAKNMKDIPVDQLEAAAEAAFTIADAFDQDVNEVTRSANQLMKDFGLTSDQAFDLITKGFQSGLDYSGEFLDTINEYSPQFKAVGFTADEFFDKLLAGAEAGAFNLDKVGDAVKEFNIRAKDGSTATSEAFQTLNLDAEKMSKTFAEGGEAGADAFNQVLEELMKIEDPVKRNEVAVALFGTQFEDLEENVIAALSTTTGEFENVEGATKKAGDALYDNFSTRATMALRDFVADLEPAGELLLDVAEDYLPKLADAAEGALTWFNDLSPAGKDAALAIGGIAAASGPVLTVLGPVATGIGGLTKGAGALASVLGKSGGAGLLGRFGLMGVAGGPVGLAIAGAAGLTLGLTALTQAGDDNLRKVVDQIDARKAEIDQLDANIAKFEELKNQNALSTDEVLRYMDIMAELKDAKTEEAIKALSDEQANLLEKSGLTNAEMEEFLGLNEIIVEEAPATAKAISEQGNAYADVLSEVKELNAAERDRLSNETYIALYQEAKKVGEALQEQQDIQGKINDLTDKKNQYDLENAESLKRIQEIDKEILGLKGEISQKGESMNQAEQAAMIEKLNGLDSEKDKLFENLQINGEMIQGYDSQIDKQNERLATVDEELALYDELSADYEALILAQAGLVAERGKGLEKLNSEQQGIDEARAKLEKQLSSQQISTQEYQEQNSELDRQQAKIDEATDKLETMNEVAGRTIYNKEVKITSSPTVESINANLGKSISKLVNVDYSVRKSAGLAPIAGAYAEGTRNAIGGLSLVGEEGPELVHLPGGSRVIPNDDTRSILSKWNIPLANRSMLSVSSDATKWHSTGGVFTKPVIAGNAGFGDVQEAIVPFEGPHAARIAGLIAKEMNNALTGMSQGGMHVENVNLVAKDLEEVRNMHDLLTKIVQAAEVW